MAARTASRKAARTPADSSAWSPAAVVPPGEVTWARSASGVAPDEMFARWEQALALPNVRGLAVGRNFLYPPGDDVAAAVDTAVSLM